MVLAAVIRALDGVIPVRKSPYSAQVTGSLGQATEAEAQAGHRSLVRSVAARANHGRRINHDVGNRAEAQKQPHLQR